MVQIHSPRPLPKSCLSLVYATFSASAAAAFCGPMWTNSKWTNVDQLKAQTDAPGPFLAERNILFEL